MIHACLYLRAPASFSRFRDCSQAQAIHLAIIGQKAPHLLHVCRESRACLLPTYKSDFASSRQLIDHRDVHPGNWRPGSNPSGGNRDALRSIFFPCYHEPMVSNTKKTMYWDPAKDIIILNRTDRPVDNKSFLAETAHIWSDHGWGRPMLHEANNIAVEFQTFFRFTLLNLPKQEFFAPKIIYVILNRRKYDGNNEWKWHMIRFKAFYLQWISHRVNHYVANPPWEVRIVQSIDGLLLESAFDKAVSLKYIRRRKIPRGRTLEPDEESWGWSD